MDLMDRAKEDRMSGALMLAGLALYISGVLFFRRPGVASVRSMPLWRVDDFLTPPGIYMALGGWLLLMTGAVWRVVNSFA